MTRHGCSKIAGHRAGASAYEPGAGTTAPAQPWRWGIRPGHSVALLSMAPDPRAATSRRSRLRNVASSITQGTPLLPTLEAACSREAAYAVAKLMTQAH
jgi:hypothetical protein